MGTPRDEARTAVAAAVERRAPLRERLADVARALQRLPRHTGVYLYVLRGDVLELDAHAGRDTEHVRIPVGTGICGLSARTRATVVVDDVAKDPRYLACNLETRSEIVVPVIRGERYLAQIDVDSDEPAAFGADDRAFLEEMATLLEPAFP
ncbi:MAG TPA: GAF domain-containing protein [Anaeromyxobacteraceae bacterium]|nr:GAF domain-containing protein [Anaeromyxobacteraceae bacterium]